MIFHRTPINYLLVNLAIADAMYATFVTPQTFLKITPTHPGGTIGTFLCKLVTGGSLAWIAADSSVITLVAIAVERYYAVIYPIGTVGKLTKGKLKVSQLQKSVNTSSIYQDCADSLFYPFSLATPTRNRRQAFMKRVYKQNAFFGCLS